MLSIECRVGRLVESRIISPLFNDELERYDAQRVSVIQRVRSRYPTFVNCADIRGVKILSAAQTKYFIEMFKNNNPLLDRAAFLLSKSTFNLQVVRVIVESHNPNRRHFDDLEELCAWLDEVLNPEERARLRAFYSEHAAPAARTR